MSDLRTEERMNFISTGQLQHENFSKANWVKIFFFFHHTCESTCDTLSPAAANQDDNTVSVAQGDTATPGATNWVIAWHYSSLNLSNYILDYPVIGNSCTMVYIWLYCLYSWFERKNKKFYLLYIYIYIYMFYPRYQWKKSTLNCIHITLHIYIYIYIYIYICMLYLR